MLEDLKKPLASNQVRIQHESEIDYQSSIGEYDATLDSSLKDNQFRKLSDPGLHSSTHEE